MVGAETGGAFSLASSLNVLKEIGFFDVILPFLLIFSVVYGILESIDLFEKKNIHAVIAFSISFLAIGSSFFTGTLKAFTPFIGVLLFFLLSFLVVMGLVAGGKVESLMKETWFKVPIIMVSSGVLIYTFGMTQGWWKIVKTGSIFSPTILPLLTLSIVFIALIFIVVGFGEE